MAMKTRERTKAELTAPEFKDRSKHQAAVLMQSFGFAEKLTKKRRQFILDIADDIGSIGLSRKTMKPHTDVSHENGIRNVPPFYEIRQNRLNFIVSLEIGMPVAALSSCWMS